MKDWKRLNHIRKEVQAWQETTSASHNVIVDDVRKEAAAQVTQAEEAAYSRYTVAVEEVQKKMTDQVARVKEEADAKYKEAVDKVWKETAARLAEAQAEYNKVIEGVRRETAAQVAQVEEAIEVKYNVVVEDVWRKAAIQVTRAEEAVLEARQRAEVAGTSAKGLLKQVKAMEKQVMEAVARAEAAESRAVNVTKRAEIRMNEELVMREEREDVHQAGESFGRNIGAGESREDVLEEEGIGGMLQTDFNTQTPSFIAVDSPHQLSKQRMQDAQRNDIMDEDDRSDELDRLDREGGNMGEGDLLRSNHRSSQNSLKSNGMSSKQSTPGPSQSSSGRNQDRQRKRHGDDAMDEDADQFGEPQNVTNTRPRWDEGQKSQSRKLRSDIDRHNSVCSER
jgi:hypothetical protein